MLGGVVCAVLSKEDTHLSSASLLLIKGRVVLQEQGHGK